MPAAQPLVCSQGIQGQQSKKPSFDGFLLCWQRTRCKRARAFKPLRAGVVGG